MDDESKSEKPVDRTFSSKTLTPQQWDIADNPPGSPADEAKAKSLNALITAWGDSFDVCAASTSTGSFDELGVFC